MVTRVQICATPRINSLIVCGGMVWSKSPMHGMAMVWWNYSCIAIICYIESLNYEDKVSRQNIDNQTPAKLI